MVGGFAVGIMESLTGAYVPVIGPEIRLPVALLVIVAVLIVKPGGLFGRSAVQRV